MAVLVVLAAALVGVLVIGLVVWVSAPRLPTGPALAPPAPQAQLARVDYNATSLTANLDEMRMILPAAPYRCDPRPGPQLPAFESLITCSVLVHENYNTAGDDWYATVGFGAPAPALDVSGNLAGTAERVFSVMRESLFTGAQTTVEKKQGAVVDLGAVGSRTVYGDVAYEVAGLPSSRDRLFVVVVELQSGDFVVVYSSRPTDLSRSTLDTLNTSLNSITAR